MTKLMILLNLCSKSAVKHVLDTQRICILDVDEEGVRSIHNTDMNALYIFVKPPSLEVVKLTLFP